MPSSQGRAVERTYETNPGEVWEEDEFWIDLSWRDRPRRRSSASASHFESLERPGEPISIDEYYELAVHTLGPRACPRRRPPRASRRSEYMRRHGAFAIPGEQHAVHERALTGAELADTVRGDDGVLRVPGTAGCTTTSDALAGHMPFIGDGSRGVEVDGSRAVGFPTPSRKLELYSPTLAEWGWPEYATPDVHPQPRPLGGPRPRRRRAHPAPDVPAADADPHPLGQLRSG